MMISAPRSTRAHGFTLLEVLMVVLVVGILSAVVLLGLNPGGPERRLNDEAERLASLLSLASSEAVMQNREYGLHLEEDGYRFLCLDEKTLRWLECVGDSLLKRHVLPDGLEIKVLTGKRMTMPVPAPVAGAPAPADPAAGTQRLEPDVLLLSSGEASAAELEVRVKEEPSLRSKVTVDEIGRVKWGDQAEEDRAHAG